ncbi:short subunit dehydrogenase-like uncharacterized protein [Branchiibius hedensis]|uniref:Uncharacterized conserved protein n=1 Tax=Branchiibius hedensis TaxID=672460 RepID=A0A2Y8ZRU4_9MICO|nr:saccharopine dehydrogenase NADP-binding domain-containing protein [Branchiibius hedensis]PWJ25821.1 short subunit dehydrogenase-like uncharacterized protein [Branchiibius hedensis]SSA34634.1 Uncharacterized conserved protein [Branchiibius hedensis]
MTERDYDIVLYGATGFVGKLTAEHLAAHAPDGVRIALAGRSPSKLEVVHADLGVDWPLVIADSSDPDSLKALAESTRVVISTVGPYAKYGLPLVEACATAGTDYVDLTGEVLFVRESIDRFHALAGSTGARIVHSCGFDSVPSDLAVYELAQVAGPLTDTTSYVRMKGGVSGGTVASAREQMAQVRSDKAKRAIALDKFALSPDRAAEPKGEWKDSLTVWHSDEMHSWAAPFIMSTFNTRIVRRSNALLGYAYGEGFRYRETLTTGDGWQGRLRAEAIAKGMAAGMAALSVGKLAPLIDKVVPAPGEGPSEEDRTNGRFSVEARSGGYRSVVAAKGDPGYAATCVMLGESALALATQRDDLPMPEGLDGGVLTPATALGSVLSDRLRAQGFTITAGPVTT